MDLVPTVDFVVGLNTRYGPGITYHQVIGLVYDGRLPAQRTPNGKGWLLDRAVEARAAALLGRTTSTAPAHAA